MSRRKKRKKLVVDVVVFKLVIDVTVGATRVSITSHGAYICVPLKHIVLMCKYNLYIGINNKFLTSTINAFKKTWCEEIEHSLLR